MTHRAWESKLFVSDNHTSFTQSWPTVSVLMHTEERFREIRSAERCNEQRAVCNSYPANALLQKRPDTEGPAGVHLSRQAQPVNHHTTQHRHVPRETHRDDISTVINKKPQSFAIMGMSADSK